MKLFRGKGFVVRHSESERVFAGIGLSRHAAAALIRAGVAGPKALLDTAWTDEEAGTRFVSLQWRLSVDPNCDAKTAREVQRVRERIISEYKNFNAPAERALQA